MDEVAAVNSGTLVLAVQQSSAVLASLSTFDGIKNCGQASEMYLTHACCF